jgi:HAD superfamily hydrolase (TIGR01509 family)
MTLQAQLHSKECFLFDLDGTLVDSNPCHEQAYRQALSARLPDVERRFSYEVCKGRRTRDALRLFGVEDEALLTKLTEAKQQAYRDLVDAGAVKLLPGAGEFLDALRGAGRRVFVVTGASARSTKAVLTGLGIIGWFEHIVTADDVAEGKPAPDCWLECMGRGEVVPAAAVAIEDAVSGIEAARAAGIDCLAVNNPELAGLPEFVGTMTDLLRAWGA